MIKNIFVPLSDTPADSNLIKTAVVIADVMQAEIFVLHGTRLPAMLPGAWGIAPELGVISEYPNIRQASKEKAERLRERLKKEKVPITLLEVETYDIGYDDIAAEKALCADLVMTASCPAQDPDHGTTLRLFQALLAKSGRPVMVVPLLARLTLPPYRVLLAWKPTPEAARAMHDALPFLEMATKVDVVHVVEQGETIAPLDPDPVAYLSGVGIHATRIEKTPPSTVAVANAILLHAHERDAALVVAGGYGHSKLREWALGGATLELFSRSPIPVLFSH